MTPTPIYFGPEGAPLFGWLHGADGAPTLGVVLCSPFGYESICSHRSLRHFAEAAARAGTPALRFDARGTGDSAGTDRDPGLVEAWIDGVLLAADELKRRTGVTHVCLLGVRLGALLAAVAASRRGDLAGLCAIAPVIGGRLHVRELRALQSAMASGQADPPGVVPEEGVDEALGFRITTETKESLSRLDLMKLDRAPAAQVLVIDRSDLPGAEKWCERLASQGVTVERKVLPGYVEMMLDPHKTEVPRQMIEAVVAWLGARRAELAAAPSSAVAAAGGERSGAEAPLAVASFDGLEERPVTIDRELFGVLSTSKSPGARRRGVVLLNSGCIHHIGPNRLYVQLARRWAALGHDVLRLDLSGIGDSRPRPGSAENDGYTRNALRDVRAAVEWMRERPGVVEVDLLGICSGAYHSFKAAVAGHRVDRVVAINPLLFFYHPGMPLDFAAFEVASETKRYRERLRDPEAWRKLARGEVKLDAVVQIVTRRVTGIATARLRTLGRWLGVKLHEDVAQELERATRQGIELRFLFGSREPGYDVLREEAGPTLARMSRGGALRIEVIEGDHTYTRLWAQAGLLAALGAALDGPPAPRPRR